MTEAFYVGDIARSANASNANFQRTLSIVTGMTVGAYMRFRRLSLAGKQLANAGAKVLDTVIYYGYECVWLGLTIYKCNSRRRSGLNGKWIFTFREGLRNFQTSLAFGESETLPAKRKSQEIYINELVRPFRILYN